MTTSSQTQPLPRRSESGLHTRAVNAAAGVLLAAMQQGQQTPTGLALALDSARLLNSPEHAAEHERLRARVAELEDRQDRHRAELTALRTDALAIRGVLAPAGRPRRVPFELGATLLPAVEWLLARIAELEAQLAEYEEPLDESPIPYALTTKAAAVRAEEADR